MTLKEENKDKKSKVYLFVIILVLFLINLALIYNLVTKNNKLTLTQEELADTNTELAEIEQLKADLEMELAEFKGQNQQLDSIINLRDAEIQEKATELKLLLQKGGITKAELQKAKTEIADLRREMEQMTEEIKRLSEENQYLKDENYVIRKQMELGEMELAKMDSINTELSDQVKVGSRIFLKSLVAIPLRNALFGDYKPTDKLKNLEKIEVLYSLANNDLAAKGEYTLYFKVQMPNKSTLVDDSKASGTFNFQGGESIYTTKSTVNFQNKNESGKVNIGRVEGMPGGEYTVMVYSEEHLMGSFKFNLR